LPSVGWRTAPGHQTYETNHLGYPDPQRSGQGIPSIWFYLLLFYDYCQKNDLKSPSLHQPKALQLIVEIGKNGI